METLFEKLIAHREAQALKLGLGFGYANGESRGEWTRRQARLWAREKVDELSNSEFLEELSNALEELLAERTNRKDVKDLV